MADPKNVNEALQKIGTKALDPYAAGLANSQLSKAENRNMRTVEQLIGDLDFMNAVATGIATKNMHDRIINSGESLDPSSLSNMTNGIQIRFEASMIYEPLSGNSKRNQALETALRKLGPENILKLASGQNAIDSPVMDKLIENYNTFLNDPEKRIKTENDIKKGNFKHDVINAEYNYPPAAEQLNGFADSVIASNIGILKLMVPNAQADNGRAFTQEMTGNAVFQKSMAELLIAKSAYDKAAKYGGSMTGRELSELLDIDMVKDAAKYIHDPANPNAQAETALSYAVTSIGQENLYKIVNSPNPLELPEMTEMTRVFNEMMNPESPEACKAQLKDSAAKAQNDLKKVLENPDAVPNATTQIKLCIAELVVTGNAMQEINTNGAKLSPAELKGLSSPEAVRRAALEMTDMPNISGDVLTNSNSSNTFRNMRVAFEIDNMVRQLGPNGLKALAETPEAFNAPQISSIKNMAKPGSRVQAPTPAEMISKGLMTAQTNLQDSMNNLMTKFANNPQSMDAYGNLQMEILVKGVEAAHKLQQNEGPKEFAAALNGDPSLAQTLILANMVRNDSLPRELAGSSFEECLDAARSAIATGSLNIALHDGQINEGIDVALGRGLLGNPNQTIRDSLVKTVADNRISEANTILQDLQPRARISDPDIILNQQLRTVMNSIGPNAYESLGVPKNIADPRCVATSRVIVDAVIAGAEAQRMQADALFKGTQLDPEQIKLNQEAIEKRNRINEQLAKDPAGTWKLISDQASVLTGQTDRLKALENADTMTAQTFGPKFQFNDDLLKARYYNAENYAQNDYKIPEGSEFTEAEVTQLTKALIDVEGIGYNLNVEGLIANHTTHDWAHNNFVEDMLINQRASMGDSRFALGNARGKIEEYLNEANSGNYKPLGEAIGKSIAMCCKNALHAPDGNISFSDAKLLDAKAADTMMDMLARHPELAQYAQPFMPKMSDVRALDGIKNISEIRTEALRSRIKLAEAAASGKELPPEEKIKCAEDILADNIINNELDRSYNEYIKSDAYQIQTEAVNNQLKSIQENIQNLDKMMRAEADPQVKAQLQENITAENTRLTVTMESMFDVAANGPAPDSFSALGTEAGLRSFKNTIRDAVLNGNVSSMTTAELSRKISTNMDVGKYKNAIDSISPGLAENQTLREALGDASYTNILAKLRAAEVPGNNNATIRQQFKAAMDILGPDVYTAMNTGNSSSNIEVQAYVIDTIKAGAEAKAMQEDAVREGTTLTEAQQQSCREAIARSSSITAAIKTDPSGAWNDIYSNIKHLSSINKELEALNRADSVIQKTFGPHFEFDQAALKGRYYTPERYHQTDYKIPEGFNMTPSEVANMAKALLDVDGIGFNLNNPNIHPSHDLQSWVRNNYAADLIFDIRSGVGDNGGQYTLQSARSNIEKFMNMADNGNWRPLGEALGKSIAAACESAFHTGTGDGVLGSRIIYEGAEAGKLVDILAKNPQMVQYAQPFLPDPRDLMAAQGMKNTLDIRMKALNSKVTLASAAAEGRELSPEVKAECAENILLDTAVNVEFTRSYADFENSPEYQLETEKMWETIRKFGRSDPRSLQMSEQMDKINAMNEAPRIFRAISTPAGLDALKNGIHDSVRNNQMSDLSVKELAAQLASSESNIRPLRETMNKFAEGVLDNPTFQNALNTELDVSIKTGPRKLTLKEQQAREALNQEIFKEVGVQGEGLEKARADLADMSFSPAYDLNTRMTILSATGKQPADMRPADISSVTNVLADLIAIKTVDNTLKANGPEMEGSEIAEMATETLESLRNAIRTTGGRSQGSPSADISPSELLMNTAMAFGPQRLSELAHGGNPLTNPLIEELYDTYNQLRTGNIKTETALNSGVDMQGTTRIDALKNQLNNINAQITKNTANLNANPNTPKTNVDLLKMELAENVNRITQDFNSRPDPMDAFNTLTGNPQNMQTIRLANMVNNGTLDYFALKDLASHGYPQCLEALDAGLGGADPALNRLGNLISSGQANPVTVEQSLSQANLTASQNALLSGKFDIPEPADPVQPKKYDPKIDMNAAPQNPRQAALYNSVKQQFAQAEGFEAVTGFEFFNSAGEYINFNTAMAELEAGGTILTNPRTNAGKAPELNVRTFSFDPTAGTMTTTSLMGDYCPPELVDGYLNVEELFDQINPTTDPISEDAFETAFNAEANLVENCRAVIGGREFYPEAPNGENALQQARNSLSTLAKQQANQLTGNIRTAAAVDHFANMLACAQANKVLNQAGAEIDPDTIRQITSSRSLKATANAVKNGVGKNPEPGKPPVPGEKLVKQTLQTLGAKRFQDIVNSPDPLSEPLMTDALDIYNQLRQGRTLDLKHQLNATSITGKTEFEEISQSVNAINNNLQNMAKYISAGISDLGPNGSNVIKELAKDTAEIAKNFNASSNPEEAFKTLTSDPQNLAKLQFGNMCSTSLPKGSNFELLAKHGYPGCMEVASNILNGSAGNGLGPTATAEQVRDVLSATSGSSSGSKIGRAEIPEPAEPAPKVGEAAPGNAPAQARAII